MPNVADLERLLIATLEDGVLSKSERQDLAKVAMRCRDDQRRFLQNKAFEMYRTEYLLADSASNEDRLEGLRWLEKTVKALQLLVKPLVKNEAKNLVCFSPGEDCRKAILNACRQAKHSIDICVFTISDNMLSDAILAAQQRGIEVRIITDNDKTDDRGSDIDYLAEQNIAVREDASAYHMHHKFALIDKKVLVNGSFNWTRSASDYNQENIVVLHDANIVKTFVEKFEDLWSRYS